MNSEVLSRIDRESTAILTFERPAKLNALNYELVDAIVHALDEIEEEEHVRAVVLTGSGRAFSAGGYPRIFKGSGPGTRNGLSPLRPARAKHDQADRELR